MPGAAEPTRVDPPTLFELPNLDPLAPFSPQPPIEDTQHVLHNSHQGPPAGHFDPPSGNQIGRERRPSNPAPSDAIDSAAARHADANVAPTESDFTPTDDTSWIGRSALVILMLVLVTLAFVAGQTLTQFRDRDATSESKLADDAGEGASTSQLATSTSATTVADAEYETEMETVEPPSYIAGPLEAKIAAKSNRANTASNPLTLGEPTIAGADSTAVNPLPEPIPNSHGAVVGFRSSPTQPVEHSTAPTTGVPTLGVPMTADEMAGAPLADLPSGMDDRLKLEDGYIRSETPFSIENFLSEEGLRMIAALDDDPDPTPTTTDDLDAAFFEIPLEF